VIVRLAWSNLSTHRLPGAYPGSRPPDRRETRPAAADSSAVVVDEVVVVVVVVVDSQAVDACASSRLIAARIVMPGGHQHAPVTRPTVHTDHRCSGWSGFPVRPAHHNFGCTMKVLRATHQTGSVPTAVVRRTHQNTLRAETMLTPTQRGAALLGERCIRRTGARIRRTGARIRRIRPPARRTSEHGI